MLIKLADIVQGDEVNVGHQVGLMKILFGYEKSFYTVLAPSQQFTDNASHWSDVAFKPKLTDESLVFSAEWRALFAGKKNAGCNC